MKIEIDKSKITIGLICFVLDRLSEGWESWVWFSLGVVWMIAGIIKLKKQDNP